MMSDWAARIVGCGYAVPPQVRTNEDPIFDWLRQHYPSGQGLFAGFLERRVLAAEASLLTLMEPAARMAMEDASVGPADIDMLIGYASLSPFATPNQLCQLHHVLQLPSSTLVVPINAEFSNFHAALLMAHGIVGSRVARTILVVIGGDWTRRVDYHTPQAISAGDGAAAVVVQGSSDLSKFRFIDQHAIVDTSYFGSMYLQGDHHACVLPCHERRELSGPAYFHIETEGFRGFDDFGKLRAPVAVTVLMAKHALQGQDLSLISHQASSVLLDAWAGVIQPRHYVETIARFGNMTLANVPVTLAWAMQHQPIVTDSLVLLSLGAEMHAYAQLWCRG
jgi:3-oxoacyl-[acyl-carrier-protein] synthase III